MENENTEHLDKEFYHKDIFGNIIDLAPAEESEDYEITKSARGEFNVFALTDALAMRKKKDAWVLYQKALASGLAAEEVFWKLVWQIKTLLIVSRTKSVSETDMKDYPYKKAKENLRYWKEGQLEELSEKLVTSYHEARRGTLEMETFIEKTLLGL